MGRILVSDVMDVLAEIENAEQTIREAKALKDKLMEKLRGMPQDVQAKADALLAKRRDLLRDCDRAERGQVDGQGKV